MDEEESLRDCPLMVTSLTCKGHKDIRLAAAKGITTHG